MEGQVALAFHPERREPGIVEDLTDREPGIVEDLTGREPEFVEDLTDREPEFVEDLTDREPEFVEDKHRDSRRHRRAQFQSRFRG